MLEMPFWGLVEVSKDVLHVVWWVHILYAYKFWWLRGFPLFCSFRQISYTKFFNIQMNHHGLLS